MKQPELGKKLSDLRKAKGLTQEELVDKCNISVRTIQRIEAGEVTPRSYTIKTILAALECDADLLLDIDGSSGRSIADSLKRFLLLDIRGSESVEFLTRQLTIAWIAGVLYFLLGFFEGAADTFRFNQGWMIFSSSVYIVIKIAVLIAFIFFQRGFILAGSAFNNYLLRILSFLLIVGNVVTAAYDIASLYYDAIERMFVLGSEAFTFGGIGIVYGVSLWRLRNPLGVIASWAGIFEVIAGCFFLTIVLGFVGFFFLMPATLLEIILLFKSVDIIRLREERREPFTTTEI